LGQVNKEKQRFLANDRILVNVTIDRSHRWVVSVFLRRENGPQMNAEDAHLRPIGST
jgi:hypothetical protein